MKNFHACLVAFTLNIIWIYICGVQEIGTRNNLQIPSKKLPKVDSILEGRITHVRDGDTFEINGKAVGILRWIVLKTAQQRDKSDMKCLRIQRKDRSL